VQLLGKLARAKGPELDDLTQCPGLMRADAVGFQCAQRRAPLLAGHSREEFAQVVAGALMIICLFAHGTVLLPASPVEACSGYFAEVTS